MLDTTCPIFHRIIENEAKGIKYGTLTFTIIIKDGIPLLNTLNITRNKRLKYKDGKRV
jgi:hypothetical protein